MRGRYKYVALQPNCCEMGRLFSFVFCVLLAFSARFVKIFSQPASAKNHHPTRHKSVTIILINKVTFALFVIEAAEDTR
jgi:hypothetical protein